MKITILRATAVSISLTIAAAISPALFANESDPANYIGTKACGICHKKDETGNQLAKWQAGPHAKAFETLASAESKAIATKMGIDDPQKSGKCLSCHATAYHFGEEVKTAKIKVEEGVSCESCHGPGKKYMAKTTMEDRQKAIAAGMIHPATQQCVMCHNEKSPTWNPERYTTKDGKKTGFDLEQAAAKTAHPNPQAKK